MSAELKKDNPINKKNNVENMLLLMLTSGIAPILAHILDLYIGEEENVWKTERIIIVFLSAAMGYIIYDKILRVLKKNGAYDKGLKLGNSDAFSNLVWMIPISIVVLYYDTIEAMIVLAFIAVIAIIIIWVDITEIEIDGKTCCLLGIYVVMNIIYNAMFNIELAFNSWLKFIGILLICQIITCCIFDVGTILLSKIKKTRSGYSESN